MKSLVKKLILLIAIAAAAAARGQANTNLLVSFTDTNPIPLTPGFAGFATEILDTGLEYSNTNFPKIAATLSPGWIRYPSGTSDDAFSWASGLTSNAWLAELGAHGDTSMSNSCYFTYQTLIGKGGAQFTNFASLAANVGGAKIICVVNGFTDTAASAGQFAGFARSNHIPVVAWELCNEPYIYQGPTNFWKSGTDYLNQMYPYYQAIKAADSNAVVAVFFTDPEEGSTKWDNDLITYSNRYWDAVSYHYYPQPGLTNFGLLMAYDNGVLLTNTTAYVTNYLAPNNNSNVTFMVTEFQPVQGSGAGTGNQSPNLPSMTLYGGIYVSEFIMRMALATNVTRVGNFQLFNNNGICATNVNRLAVTTAANNGYVTNTQNLSFGFYLSAQVTAEAVAYWGINRSTAMFPTTVSNNGPVVPADTNGVTTMPAIYAQAFQGNNGKRYVILTNKGSNSVPVDIYQDGAELADPLQETFVTGSDPSATNSSPSNPLIQIQSQTTTNPVTIPQYSVVRLEWTVFSVPPPTLSLSAGGAQQNLAWTGLTNVTYSVQEATNALGIWATVGKATSPQTNFLFTNWDDSPAQIYRLVVP